jgi:polyketide synthase 12
VPLGQPRAERADAARNREVLLHAARQMLAERGANAVTMDGLAERANVGKGTVFRRFGSRAGIFQALLDADERDFQHRVLAGPPPLGPGADPGARLVAYGRARIAFLADHRAIARAALDRKRPAPAGEATITRLHVRMLLVAADVAVPDVDSLAVQLTGALEGPMLLYLATDEDATTVESTNARDSLAESWQVLVERLLAR